MIVFFNQSHGPLESAANLTKRKHAHWIEEDKYDFCHRKIKESI